MFVLSDQDDLICRQFINLRVDFGLVVDMAWTIVDSNWSWDQEVDCFKELAALLLDIRLLWFAVVCTKRSSSKHSRKHNSLVSII
jgi:hypothetical protein